MPSLLGFSWKPLFLLQSVVISYWLNSLLRSAGLHPRCLDAIVRAGINEKSFILTCVSVWFYKTTFDKIEGQVLYSYRLQCKVGSIYTYVDNKANIKRKRELSENIFNLGNLPHTHTHNFLINVVLCSSLAVVCYSTTKGRTLFLGTLTKPDSACTLTVWMSWLRIGFVINIFPMAQRLLGMH